MKVSTTRGSAIFQYLSVHMLSVSVQSEVREFPPETVILQDVQHARHLTEDEHT